MKKIVKSIIAVLLILVSISATTVVAKIDYDADVPKRFKHNGFVYSFWGKKQVALRGYVGKKKKITIPKKIKGNDVVTIDLYGTPGAFKGVEEIHYPNKFNIGGLGSAKQLKKVTVNKSNPKYIVKNNLVLSKDGTKIEACPGGLKNVKIPNSVTTIDVTSFSCNDIKKVTFGKNVTLVDLSAFDSCKKLKTIKFNDNLKQIEYDGFGYCSSLLKIELPEGFETLGTEAFKNCTNLKTVKIPSTTKLIDNGAFEGCSNLEKIFIYSKDCKIDPGEYDRYYKKYLSETIPKTATIYGYKGSTAEKYAKKHGIVFVAIY